MTATVDVAAEGTAEVRFNADAKAVGNARIQMTVSLNRETDAFEQHIATPHGLDFANAAALYGCGFDRPASLGALRAAVERSIAGSGTTIIEVRTDRVENLALHRRVAEAALAAIPRG